MLAPPSTQTHAPIPQLTLPLSSDDYQTYVAFLSKSCEDLIEDDHLLYLVKNSFDHCLDHLSNEELDTLVEKQDMYLNFVMYSTFKSCQICSEEEFEKHHEDLIEFYDATDDELLFLAKIDIVVHQVMAQQQSPFALLKTYSPTFTPTVLTKLTCILKFLVGHSLTYLMTPNKIFGLCLKWTLNHYHITNPSIHHLSQQFIDINTPWTQEKLSQISQIMHEVMSMSL